MAQVMTSGSRQPVVKRTQSIEQLKTPDIQTDSGTAQATHKPTKLQLWPARHGETEWSLSDSTPGRTDLPLTPVGEQQAGDMGKLLRGQRLGIVLTITLLRARETCRLKGYGDNAVVDPHLRERDYGEYEGRTTAEIQEQRRFGAEI
jgi:bisphosphoglycerate-dependent phosphoglycerate mutase